VEVEVLVAEGVGELVSTRIVGLRSSSPRLLLVWVAVPVADGDAVALLVTQVDRLSRVVGLSVPARVLVRLASALKDDVGVPLVSARVMLRLRPAVPVRDSVVVVVRVARSVRVTCGRVPDGVLDVDPAGDSDMVTVSDIGGVFDANRSVQDWVR
jgi:hypothetical protein